MEEEISKEVFIALVQTGALDLSTGEAEDLRLEMNRQMRMIRGLDSIPLDEMQPVIHGNPYPQGIRCDLRADEWQPFDNVRGILDGVPRIRENMIVSPDVPHQKIG